MRTSRWGAQNDAVGLCALRQKKPHPMFFFEMTEPDTVIDVDGLVARGWQLMPNADLHAIDPPFSEDWGVLIEDGNVTVFYLPDLKNPLFDGPLPSTPPGWLELVEAMPAVMLVSGALLGLADFDGLEQRLEQASKAGNLCTIVAGIVRRAP